MSAENWQIVVFFFLIASLYSSVGFGGGSSYISILAFYGLPFTFVRSVALICNIVVVSNSTVQYWRNGLLNLKKIIPLVLLSVPLAFIGGKIPLKEKSFFILLGVTLLIASLLMWFQPKTSSNGEKRKLSDQKQFIFDLLVGGFIGFVSGMVGIGGGIFLSPLLYILKWDEAKKISAASTVFILVNSVSGLIGQNNLSIFETNKYFVLALVLAVFVGGFLGNYLTILKLKQDTVRKATALLIAYVSVNLLTKYLG
jgi:uncharacterized membrane protein YfcA